MGVLVGVRVWKFPFGEMILRMMSICLEPTLCPILDSCGEKSIIPPILLEHLDLASICGPIWCTTDNDNKYAALDCGSEKGIVLEIGPIRVVQSSHHKPHYSYAGANDVTKR